MKVFIGTSGWQYPHWKEKFYPKNLRSQEYLKFYTQFFNTVEINTTFYHFTKKETFQKWKNMVPANFLFAIKLYRVFTHFRKLNLKEADKELLLSFFDNISVLKENLGPVLIQLPPSFKNKTNLEKFIKLFKSLAQEIFNKNLPLIALEIRNKNLLSSEIYQFLKKEEIIFVISDSPKWATEFIKTHEVVYIRFHGKPDIFASKYSENELKEFAEKLKKLNPESLFVYFNNDAEGYAVENALEIKKFLE